MNNVMEESAINDRTGGAMVKKPFPIGVDNFSKLIRENYYYVDKTMLIKELLDLKGEVILFTRPCDEGTD